MAPGASLVKNGEKGRGVASRWYPQTLAQRIREIGRFRNRIEFLAADAFGVIPDYLNFADAAFFIDPPYTAGGKRAGKRLYLHNEVDHARLFDLMAQAKGFVMMTYDDVPEPRAWAEQQGFIVQTVPMLNTHHAPMFELVITNTVAARAVRYPVQEDSATSEPPIKRAFVVKERVTHANCHTAKKR